MRINPPVLNVWFVAKNGKVHITAARNEAVLAVDRIVLYGSKNAKTDWCEAKHQARGRKTEDAY